MDTIECCAICAWRATCQKKFSISGSSLKCPDFVRDITIKPEECEKEEDKDAKEDE